MFEGMPRLKREYRFAITVVVDKLGNPEYEAAMDKHCEIILNELKAICRTWDRGTGRTSIEIEKVV